VPFIRKPVATTLLVVAITLAGAAAYRLLPVSPLPQVEFPTISVNAGLPGASPETMASSVATPLERQFGRIAAVTEMTSSSALGSTSITLQFDLNRDIDAAARDVQAAINAARGNLPSNLPNNPSYRKVNPADSPIFMLALTSPVLTRGQMYDAASTIMAQKLAQVEAAEDVFRTVLWTHEHMDTDMPVEAEFWVGKAITDTGWGLQPQWIYSREETGARKFDPVLHSAADLKKLHFPEVSHDAEASRKQLEFFTDLFGDILTDLSAIVTGSVGLAASAAATPACRRTCRRAP